MRGDIRRVPEARDAVDVFMTEVHVCGELIGQPADLAAAHGVGLAGERERAAARLADAAGHQMAVDDGVDLVGALRRLVHPLREAGDDLFRRAEQREEARHIGGRKPGAGCGRHDIGRDFMRARQRLADAGGVRVDIAVIERVAVGEMHQQPAEQRGVHAGRNRQEQIGVLDGRGAARIDDDDLGAARALVGDHALVQHRMAPGGVGADQNDEIGLVEIAIVAGHGVGAEGAAMAGDRRRHAQARIGVDIGRAEEALHQLVGDVIVLGEQLAGQIEGDRVRPVLRDGAGKAVRDLVERVVPRQARQCSVALARHRMQQARRKPERLAERGPLRAETAEIRRMIGIAGDHGAAAPVGLGQHAAADAAIGAGGAHGRRMLRGRVHQ